MYGESKFLKMRALTMGSKYGVCMRRVHNIRLEMPWGRNECSNGNACVTGVNMDDRTKTSTMGATSCDNS
jgi:hypothetical protein